MSGSSSNERTAKKARHAGHVVLNVGGTRFSTSTTTLSSSSAYFQSLFSEEWAGSRGNGDDEEVFVDQDPEPFRVLLSYMRLGKIQASDLTLQVLLQAQYFGMERLLAAIRGVARRSEDDSPLLKAARAAELVPKVEKKEFARLSLIDRDMCFDGQDDLSIWNGRDIVALVEHDRTAGASQKRTFTTFVDGLNWLHRKGFTKYEQKMEKDFGDSNYHLLGVLYFSKMPPDDNHSEDLASTIAGAVNCTRERNQFAACLSVPNIGSATISWIEADIGKEEDKDRRQITGPVGALNVKSRVSRIETSDGDRSNPLLPNQLPGWLQRNEFLRRERDLEDVYRNALYSEDLKNLKDDEFSSVLTLWSRDVEA